MPLLEVKDLEVYYGGIHALRGVSASVESGQIVTIIGSNGAGKSTLLNAISGVVPYKSGELSYKGEALPHQANKIVKLGISQVPEGRLIFANLSVRENLMMGSYLRRDKEKIKQDFDVVMEVFPRLQERIGQMAGTLSGGEQQMLAMGRGLMSDPELIMLDEPSLGLAPLLVNTIFEIILKIKNLGKTILLVEQNAYKALSVADYAYVLEQGVIAKHDVASKIANDPAVQKAYLGTRKS